MSGNFQDWKKTNPAKSFLQYKNEVCQQQDQPPDKPVNLVPSNRKSRLDLIVLIVSVVSIAALAVIFEGQIGTFAKQVYAQYNVSRGKFHAVHSSEWQLFTSVAGNFEILFPGEPDENRQKVLSEIGELDLVMFIITPEPGLDDNLNYIVAYTQYPAYTIDSRFMTGIEIDQFLQQTVQSSSENVNGVIYENSKTKYNSFPGIKFTIGLEQGKAVMRGVSYLVNNTVYSINVIEPVLNKENKSTEKFIGSFRLLE